jgi:hypothetical protein
VDDYVSRYEEFLTVQAYCWRRWRIHGSTKLDQSELEKFRASMQYYEDIALEVRY